MQPWSVNVVLEPGFAKDPGVGGSEFPLGGKVLIGVVEGFRVGRPGTDGTSMGSKTAIVVAIGVLKSSIGVLP